MVVETKKFHGLSYGPVIKLYSSEIYNHYMSKNLNFLQECGNTSNIFLVKVEIVMTVWGASYKIEDAYRPPFSNFTLINISQNNCYQSRL